MANKKIEIFKDKEEYVNIHECYNDVVQSLILMYNYAKQDEKNILKDKIIYWWFSYLTERIPYLELRWRYNTRREYNDEYVKWYFINRTRLILKWKVEQVPEYYALYLRLPKKELDKIMNRDKDSKIMQMIKDTFNYVKEFLSFNKSSKKTR